MDSDLSLNVGSQTGHLAGTAVSGLLHSGEICAQEPECFLPGCEEQTPMVGG
jgi:hypothetical protein